MVGHQRRCDHYLSPKSGYVLCYEYHSNRYFGAIEVMTLRLKASVSASEKMREWRWQVVMDFTSCQLAAKGISDDKSVPSCGPIAVQCVAVSLADLLGRACETGSP